MQLKPLVAASALALASFGSHAANTNWGAHELSPSFEAQIVSPVPLFFGDTYSFTLGSTAEVTSGVLAIGSTIGIYALLDSSNAILGGPLSFGSEHTFTLGAGSYSYAVLGFAPTGGGYAIGSVATPVPEPETYAMLLAGLGVVGFLSRRRRAD